VGRLRAWPAPAHLPMMGLIIDSKNTILQRGHVSLPPVRIVS
jgi:hypothetical protein